MKEAALRGLSEERKSLFSRLKKIRPASFLLTIIIVFVFVMPVIRLFSLSFLEDGVISFAHYQRILSEARTWRTIENTAWLTLGSTAISAGLGLFFAWLIAYSDIRAKNALQLLLFIPFLIPSYIVTLAWTQFTGRNGLLAAVMSLLPGGWQPVNLYSMGGMIFVLGLSHFPLVYLFTVSVLRKIPRDLEWSARASGASPWRVFSRITLPLALPGLGGGSLLAFIANIDNFGIPAFLGIPAGISVLSTAIYQEVAGFGPGAFSRAAVLSVLLSMVALAGTALQWFLVRKSKQLETVKEDHSPRFSLGKKRRFVEVTVWCFLLFITIVPVISMVMSSLIRAHGLAFTPENLTLKHYAYVLLENERVQGAVLNSLFLATAATIICFIIGTTLAYLRIRQPGTLNRTLELFVGLPYALPGMVLALAMIFMWLEPIPGWNPGIYGTVGILLVAYVTRFMILQVRGSMTAMAQVDVSMEEAARLSGAGFSTRWRRILVPLLLPGLLSGAFLVFLTAITELTVSSLLWSSGSETIGLVIFNFEQAGYSTYSTAFSAVIVAAIIIVLLLMYSMQYVWKKRVKET